MDELDILLQETIERYVSPGARVLGATPLPGGEQGYSGATVSYYDVRFATVAGTTEHVHLITKDGALRERRVLARLGAQGHPTLPFSHTLDLTTDAPALFCQQYVGKDRAGAAPAFAAQVAEGLAAIHAANLRCAAEMDWLPRADHTFFVGTLLAVYWRPHWETTIAHAAFAAEFGEYAPKLEEAAAHFLRTMDALWNEGDSLTLTHADIYQPHVLVYEGRPYFIDWGQAKYGSFYLDLPNYFTPETVLLYRDALARHGHDIPVADFLERYYEVGRYPGFTYMPIPLSQWRVGGTLREESRPHLLTLLDRAMHGWRTGLSSGQVVQ
jgi:hypothetical protein